MFILVIGTETPCGVTKPLRIISFIKAVKSDDQLRKKDQLDRWFDE